MPSKTSILEVLTQPNPGIDASFTKPGGNTTSPDWPDIDTWSPWRDFDARKLYEMYRHIVDAEWAFDLFNDPEPSRWHQRIFDEDSLEHYLSTFMLPRVNAALGHACRVLGLAEQSEPNIGRGGRCFHQGTTDRRFKPDWSLCLDFWFLESGLYQNLLPGDSKLSRKWNSGLYQTDGHYLWKDPVRQILHYISQLNLRYGWLITDRELVVFRASVQLTGPGQALDRPARQQQLPMTHNRAVSAGTEISQLSSAIESTSLDESSAYQPPDAGVEQYHVEYQAIPWASHGGGMTRLSIRSALFYLSMMAAFGERAMMGAYPTFNSWWYRDDGAFVHNMTGMVTKNKTPPVLEHPNPSGERRPEWVTFPSEDGESEDFLTRTSVRTLDVDHQRQEYFYDVLQQDEHGNQISHRIFVTEDMLVYDEETGVYGRFKTLVWIAQTATQEECSSSRCDKRHRKGDRPH